MSDRYGYIAIETLLNFCENSKDHAVTPNDFMRMARVRVPDHLRESTKMMERKTGRWVILRDEYGDIVEAVCSNCHMNGRHEWAYCPHCGADMRGEKNESFD